MIPVNELALATNEELIDELVLRGTFVGMVIRCQDDLRGAPWDGEERYFTISSNDNMSDKQRFKVLMTIAEHLAGKTNDDA